MAIEWRTFNEKKVLVVDYRNIKLEREMIAIVNQIPEYIKDLPDGATLLALVDLTGAFATPGFMDASKKLEKLFDRLKTKRAIVGITGPKAVLLKGFNLFTKNKLVPFPTETEAIKYLLAP